MFFSTVLETPIPLHFSPFLLIGGVLSKVSDKAGQHDHCYVTESFKRRFLKPDRFYLVILPLSIR